MPGARTATRCSQGSKSGLLICTSAVQGDPSQSRDARNAAETEKRSSYLEPGGWSVLHSKARGRVTRNALDVRRPQARTSQAIKSLEFGGTQNGEGRGSKAVREGPCSNPSLTC